MVTSSVASLEKKDSITSEDVKWRCTGHPSTLLPRLGQGEFHLCGNKARVGPGDVQS